MARRLSMLGVVVAGLSGTAFAQTAPALSRGFLVVNGGYQLTANDFDTSETFRANAEDGRLTTQYEVKSGLAYDFAVGAALWRHLGVGVGITRLSISTPSAVSGSVPHPFFFNRGRSVTGEAAGLTREEFAVHIQARVIAPVGTRVQVMVFGGPSFFKVKQGLVTGVTWTDSYPYDAATFATAQVTSAEGSKIGFHAGGDVAVFFSRHVGVGGTVQVASATVPLPDQTRGTRDIKAGGTKVGGGLRVRF